MDYQIRTAAFEWLEKQVLLHGDLLPRTVLEQGFVFNGQRITLLGPQGIWKPKALALPLSITTVPRSYYEDKFLTEGLLEYRYRGDDPYHRDNMGLREAMRSSTPLIYFLGIKPGKYLAIWPVFIVGDTPHELAFRVLMDEKSLPNLKEGLLKETSFTPEEVADYQRHYASSQTRVRLHQRVFRARVLTAYREQCAFCRLRHPQLLDAAHIIPDLEESGEPVVPNGLSLCKIHHAAYDSNFIGVSPDYEIIVREDILEEIDGPMLRHGIQEMHEQKIILPVERSSWPDRERLAVRFEKFRNAG